MVVQELSFDGFRNLKTGNIRPVPGVNIVYGNNAQGKTNLLEAFWLFTGGRSFRGAKDGETVAFGRDKATLRMKFTAEEREQEAEITIEKKRSVTLNGISHPLSGLAGHFCAVVFSPVHLSLIKGSPEERRRFLDAAYCQLRPGYIRILSDYQKTLTQRNALIKAMRQNGGSRQELEIWNEKLAKTGAQVFAARSAYVRKLSAHAAEVYAGFSGGKEPLTICYRSAAGNENTTARQVYENLLSQLKNNIETDMAVGFTTVGPHRDDLEIGISGLSSRIYASQGQQRSAVLSLKLAEASVLREVTGEQPIALLDDVMSELDVYRQDYILNQLHGWQVFLTCCDPSAVLRLTAGNAFSVNNGYIAPMKRGTRETDGEQQGC